MSNPFHSLEELHQVDTGGESTVCNETSRLDALKEELKPFSLDVLGDKIESTHHTTDKVSAAIAEDERESIGEEKGWEQVSGTNKRDQYMHEVGPIARIERSGVDSLFWRAARGTTNTSESDPPHRIHTGTCFTRARTRHRSSNVFFRIPISELCEGVIIWHTEMHECYDQFAEGDIFYSQDGQKHFRKGRFSVITSVHTFSFHRL